MLSPEKYSNPKDLTYYLSCTTSQTTELWTCKGHIADLYWCKRNVCLHSSRSGYLRQAFYYPKITKLLSLQRCVACEVRVNLNYSTEVHFTLFYWFKSLTWQCKWNGACVKVTWKPGKQQTWRLILRWRKVHSGLHSPALSNSAIYYWNDSWVQTFHILCILFIQTVNVNV